jgi:hypothetical protein
VLEQVNKDLARFWAGHGSLIVLIALGAVALFMLVGLLVSWRRKRFNRWVSAVSGVAVLGLSAEGMWMVAVQKLHLAPEVAVCVFFVVEALMLNSATHARAYYKATTVRDDDGKIIKPGRPGKHGRAVWIIAAVGGTVVAFNAHSVTEFLLRLALPLGWALMWWNELTQDGTSESEETSRWRWTPRRLLLWLGAIEPGDRDMKTINRDRLRATMTELRCELEAAPEKKRDKIERKLRKLARDADDSDIAEVGGRVTRAEQVKNLTAPGAEDRHAAELAELRAAHERELTEARKATRAELEDEYRQQYAELTAEQERQVEQFRAELAGEQGRAADDARRELEQARAELDRARRTAADRERQVGKLEAELARLREQLAGASGRHEGADSRGRGPVEDGGRVIGGGSAASPSTAAPASSNGRGSRRDQPEPVMSSGSAVPAPRATSTGQATSTRATVMGWLDAAYLDGTLRLDDPDGLVKLAEGYAEQLHADTATVARYARTWRRDVESGKRKPAREPRLTVVRPSE